MATERPLRFQRTRPQPAGFDERKCQGCPIEGEHRPIEAVGPENAKFLVVTDVPSQTAAKEKRILPPATLRVFADEMMACGFERNDFRFVPSCFCAYDTDATPNKVKTAIHKHCRQHLVDEVRKTDPECVVPLGAVAATQAIGRATKITKVRGLPQDSEEFHRPVFPLLSPGQVVMYPQNLPIFRADVQSFARFFDHGYDAASASTEHGEYVFVEDLQFLIDLDPELLAFDMENTSLRHYQKGVDVRTFTEARRKDPTFIPRAQILTMQFTVEAGKSYVLVWDHPERPVDEAKKPHLRNQLRQLLCKPSRIVIGQNIKYDAGYLKAVEGIHFRIGGDTLMLATLVDENAMERNLDVLTKIYAPEMAGYADLFNATHDKSRMWEISLDEIRGYGGGDTDAAFRVYAPLEDIVANDHRLWQHYIRVSLPGLNAFVGLESRGMHVDTHGAMHRFRDVLSEEVNKSRESILKQIPRQIKLDHIAAKKGDVAEALKLSRTALLSDILFKHPAGFKLKPKVFTKGTEKLPDHLKEPSTSSKDHLPFFFDTCPFTYELAEYVKNERLLSTNIVGFEHKYVVDGMVRPTYGLCKAVTGRTNSDDPNGQNYPKRGKMAKTYGQQFVAPPGHYMIAPDLSQAELRIAASMANEPTMIEIYRSGGDIHKATAAIVMGVTDEAFAELDAKVQKEARQKAKAVNFGFLYGMWWKKFIVYAKTQYGVDFTPKEAELIRKNFFKKYKRLEPWHNRVKEFVSEHGMMRSYTGRVRHLPTVHSSEEYIVQEAMRQGINSPVQETGSSLGVIAIGRIHEEIDSRYLPIVGFIHDSIIAYVRKEYLDWGLKTLIGYMQGTPMKEWFGTEIKVPVVADASFGDNFGELIECPGFKLDQPYAFNGLVDKEGKPLLKEPAPIQLTPPNGGRLTRSVYTLDTDLEDELDHSIIEEMVDNSIRRVRRTRPAARAA